VTLNSKQRLVRISAIAATILAALSTSIAAAVPNVLVVCPTPFRDALAPWEELRRKQGHEFEVIDVPKDASELKAVIRKIAAGGRLETIVLVGDVPIDSTLPELKRLTIPTNYVPAKVNRRWGSEPTIASDAVFADTNGDGTPDVAVGRIPADTPAQLAAVVRKIIRYETRTEHEPWDRRLAAVAGAGDFGVMADALIEAAGQQIMKQALPPGYLVALTRAKTGSAVLGPMNSIPLSVPSPNKRAPIGQQIDEGSLLWVYLGHAHPTALDYVAGPTGPESILSVEDVPQLRGAARCPLAFFVSCYTGACDATSDSLAEALLLAEEGPVSVVAATRVSMPYGNTVFSYEFLRASLGDRPATLGDAFRLAQQRTFAAGDGDAMRKSIDSMATSLSPMLHKGNEIWRPEDLATERREHVAMYQLLGDPLLRWRRPRSIKLTAAAEAMAGAPLIIEGGAEFEGNCIVELARMGGTSASHDGGAKSNILATVSERVRNGAFRISLPIPADASGPLVVRAYLRGEAGSAVGGANILVRPAAASQ